MCRHNKGGYVLFFFKCSDYLMQARRFSTANNWNGRVGLIGPEGGTAIEIQKAFTPGSL